MVSSLFPSKIYRICGRIIAVIGIFTLLLQIVLAQRPRRVAADKGPRAMGLIEFSPNGKAHLIPITIMVDGKFYDAAAYKASPVPMALEWGTVYEAVRSGVSQGLFTINTAFSGATKWRAEGTWQSAAEMQAEAAKKKAREAAKPAKKNEDQDAPPKLRRAGSDKSGSDKSASDKAPSDKSASDKSGSDKNKTSVPAPTAPSPGPSPSASTTSTSPTAPSTVAPQAAQLPSPSSSSDEDDPDRPHLRRGSSRAANPAAVKVETSASTAQGPATNSKIAASSFGPFPEPKVIPAISDAGGPDPKPYTFDMKPEEEGQFRKKMVALAALEISARAKLTGSESAAPPAAPHTTAHRSKSPKSPEPTFEGLQLRVFDLSTSNEPVLVLTATAHLPASEASANPAPIYFVTLVAREDIYGDLHKALANVTDNQHLEVLPRLDLIDAVDVDGDGRGELLFRQVYDRGSAYVVYRVIGNQLWPLYQGTVG